MVRGNSNRGRGFRGSPPRGGRGRGGFRGRGRGGGGGGQNMTDELDFVIQMWPDNAPHSRGFNSPRSRGRGRGNPFYTPQGSGLSTPTRGSGTESPRGGRGRGGRGRGNDDYQSPRGGASRGRGGPKLRQDAPLSRLLYQERPLLRPVIFVRSVHNRTLFEEEEDIFQATVEEAGEEEESHLPTADQVARVFSGGNFPPAMDPSDDDRPEDLEEIDFEDMARIREEIEVATLLTPKTPPEVAEVEARFTGFFIDSGPSGSTESQDIDIDPTPPTEGRETYAEHPVEILSVAESNDTHVHSDLTMDTEQDLGPISASDATPRPDSAMNLEQESGTLAALVGSSELDIREQPSPTTPIEEFTGFFIDTSSGPVTDAPVAEHHALETMPLGYQPPVAEHDEVIVYVAPHPRAGRLSNATPLEPQSAPDLPSTSMLTGTTQLFSSSNVQPSAPAFESVSFSFTPSPKKQPTRQAPVFSVGGKVKAKVKVRKQEARAARRRVERQAMFGSFGAMLSEAQLRGGKVAKDPRWEDRRRDDSDVDWGDEDMVEDGPSDDGGEGMQLDPDLEIDLEAMKGFVHGMSAQGGRHVTMDDIADEERMRREDEEDRIGGSSDESDDESDEDDEADGIVDGEESMLIAEPRGHSLSDEDSSDEDDFSSDEDQTPRTGFQARLERVRNAARGKRIVDARPVDDSSDEDDFMRNSTWADEDDDFRAQIQDILDENEEVLTGHNRKEKNRLFKAIRNGAFDDMEGITPAKRRKDKYKDLPEALREQWQKDRDKKAENKRARAQMRLEAAADPFGPHKGGKKGRKAMLAAARLDPTITSIPNRIFDMATLETQIRQFIANVGGRTSMTLPPMDKGTRKDVHELALAFKMKSVSHGKGEARYTVLSKTTRTGYGIDEKRVAYILRRHGVFVEPYGKGKNKVSVMPKHRDGDEVGKAAPKIGSTNIGFKMLALMGWSEGERIGVSGGLDVPLTAVIKNTKLGLGANR